MKIYINNNLVGNLGGQYSEETTNEFKDKLDENNDLINSGNLTQAETNKTSYINYRST